MFFVKNLDYYINNIYKSQAKNFANIKPRNTQKKLNTEGTEEGKTHRDHRGEYAIFDSQSNLKEMFSHEDTKSTKKNNKIYICD